MVSPAAAAAQLLTVSQRCTSSPYCMPFMLYSHWGSRANTAVLCCLCLDDKLHRNGHTLSLFGAAAVKTTTTTVYITILGKAHSFSTYIYSSLDCCCGLQPHDCLAQDCWRVGQCSLGRFCLNGTIGASACYASFPACCQWPQLLIVRCKLPMGLWCPQHQQQPQPQLIPSSTTPLP